MVVAVCHGMGGGLSDIDLILDWTPRRLFCVYQEMMMLIYQGDAARQGVPRNKARLALCAANTQNELTQEQRDAVERHVLVN